MGIAPYKYFTFDGASSRDYGVYLTGEGVFNAPERVVDMVEIPGRNGNYALDHGKFNNITVTYKAGIVDASESNFADKMSAVRNWLCSKVGYKRLSDDYNPNEYRMAVFKSGVKVDHENLSTGEFEITFDCKPQRWLTSGETATAVANNGTLSNPTLFDASPLLAVKGYGNINIGGHDIDIENVPLGTTLLIGEFNETTNSVTKQFNGAQLNTSDTFTFDCTMQVKYSRSTGYTVGSITEVSKSGVTVDYNAIYHRIDATFGELTFTKGTSATHTGSVQYTISITRGSTSTYTRTATFNVAYDGDETITVSITGTLSVTGATVSQYISATDTYGNSTVPALGNPLYIDLDIGECWNEDSGTPISLNEAVQLGSDLPVLPPGSTTFTYDGTVTELKVTPRWWKV